MGTEHFLEDSRMVLERTLSSKTYHLQEKPYLQPWNPLGVQMNPLRPCALHSQTTQTEVGRIDLGDTHSIRMTITTKQPRTFTTTLGPLANGPPTPS